MYYFVRELIHYLVKSLKMSIYIAFRRLDTIQLTTHLAVLETATKATSRALH